MLGTALTTAQTANVGPGTVILMGLGIVFFGLIVIIALISLMSWIVRLATKEKPVKKATSNEENEADFPEIANKDEFVAAVSAAIAEDLGEDISKLRIVSIRRI